MIRQPAVAGQFYSSLEKTLLEEVTALIDKKSVKERAIGVVSPHAGYIYSGRVAGSVLASIEPRPIYIIMGPNHTGLGSAFSLSPSESWKTPLGNVRVNNTVRDKLKSISRWMKEDKLAHASEHSIEVQLPFLQVIQKEFTFVPIVISHASIEIYKEIGKELASVIKDLKLEKEITIVASSDMTHYEEHEAAKKKDASAIKAILDLDEDMLVRNIQKYDITMCGYAPTAIMLVASKELGAKSARLIKYETSGDTSGDYSSVVGYAGILIT